jgi:hypothetical protein
MQDIYACHVEDAHFIAAVSMIELSLLAERGTVVDWAIVNGRP